MGSAPAGTAGQDTEQFDFQKRDEGDGASQRQHGLHRASADKVGTAPGLHPLDEGREITIYRLFDRDLCLFSASCMLRSIQFEITIEAEKDSELWIIPPDVYQGIMAESAPVANYTNELMASRFSEVMWLMEQVMWKSLDKRLAAFLLTSLNRRDQLPEDNA